MPVVVTTGRAISFNGQEAETAIELLNIGEQVIRGLPEGGTVKFVKTDGTEVQLGAADLTAHGSFYTDVVKPQIVAADAEASEPS